MVFGYNDLVWILSVIVWTTGITAIIMYIIKEEELHGLLNVNMISSQTRLIFIPSWFCSGLDWDWTNFCRFPRLLDDSNMQETSSFCCLLVQAFSPYLKMEYHSKKAHLSSQVTSEKRIYVLMFQKKDCNWIHILWLYIFARS